MKLQCTLEVRASSDVIWPFYADPAKRPVWEEDLENLVFDGNPRTGTTGQMKLKDMPEFRFTLTEVIQNQSWCDKTEIPGIGFLHFDHKILQENGKTLIHHKVWLEKAELTENDVAFLCGVFSDVPSSMFKIKRAAEK